MSNRLNIDLYKDGYNNYGINCVDEAIAYASGYFNHNNYFFYCFLYSISVNWGDIHFPENQNIILKKLGLTIRNNEIKDGNSMYLTIKSMLDNNRPICMILDYFYLFYNDDYYKKLHTPHGVVVSGYDSERSIITIRENCHIGWKLPLYEFNLDKDMFLKIFEQSNEYFKKNSYSFYDSISNMYYYPNEMYFCDCVYSIEEYYESELLSCKDLIKEYLDSQKNKNNNLIKVITDFDYLIKIFSNYKLAPAQFKRNYLESLDVIFNFIERRTKLLSENKNIKNEFDSFRNYYMKKRSSIVSYIIVNAMREKSLKSIEIEQIISKIKILDQELFEFMSKLYSLY